MRLALVAAIVMAALTPLHAAAARFTVPTRNDYFQRVLTSPNGGDDMLIRRVFHQDAQQRSNRLFAALAKVLGGKAPTLNFVPDVGFGGEFHASATPATNTINLDAATTQGLIDDGSNLHDPAVNVMPHEMAHLRQTPMVLASLADREGGAQAFADLVSPIAAAMAKIPYGAGFYDGAYTDLVKAARAKGNDWLLGGQFGKPPVTWP